MKTFKEEKNNGNVKNLIPVHINKSRCHNYFWNWDEKIGDWVRGNKISDVLKRAYKNPSTKSYYK